MQTTKRKQSRPTKDESEKKIPVAIYIRPVDISTLGGMDAIRDLLRLNVANELRLRKILK